MFKTGFRSYREQRQVQEHVQEGRSTRGHPGDIHVRGLRRGREGLVPGTNISHTKILTGNKFGAWKYARATLAARWLSGAATGAGSSAGSSAGASVAQSRTCPVCARGKAISHIKEKKKKKCISLNSGFPLLQDFQVQGLDSVQRDLNNNRPRIEGGGEWKAIIAPSPTRFCAKTKKTFHRRRRIF